MPYTPKRVKTDVGLKTPAMIAYKEELDQLDVIQPRGSTGEYSNNRNRYITGENSSVLLNEMQANLAKLLAEEPTTPLYHIYVKAGYNISSYYREADSLKRFKAHIMSNLNAKKNVRVTELSNYLKYGSAEQLKIDATWLLNEQINLYEECRRGRQYVVAARLLDNLADHVDINSKASKHIVVDQGIDYAALLSEGESRLRLEEIPVEGEYTESPIELPTPEEVVVSELTIEDKTKTETESTCLV